MSRPGFLIRSYPSMPSYRHCIGTLPPMSIFWAQGDHRCFENLQSQYKGSSRARVIVITSAIIICRFLRQLQIPPSTAVPSAATSAIFYARIPRIHILVCCSVSVVFQICFHDGLDLFARQGARHTVPSLERFLVVSIVISTFCEACKHEIADLPQRMRKNLLLICFPRSSHAWLCR